MWGKGLRNTAVAFGVTLALAGCQSLSQPSPDSSSVLQIARWGRTEQPEKPESKPPIAETPIPPANPEKEKTETSSILPDAINEVVCDLLASLNTAQMAEEPCILVDPASFPSEGLTPEEVEDLVVRLRIELNRAANGNVYFVSPVQVGIQKAKGRAGYQYRLNGRFSALESAGSTRPSHTLNLELQNAAGGAPVWNGACSFARE